MAKQRSGDNKYPTCCFCCHVRLGALLIGLWYLVGQLTLFGLLAYMMVNPEKFPEHTEVSIDYVQDNGEAAVYVEQYHNSSDYCVMLIMAFCYFVITCMHIYGVSKHQSCYLLPFFCIQLFEFCIACLTVIGIVSYYPEDEQYYNNIQEYFMGLMDHCGISIEVRWWTLIIVFVLMVALSIKAYFISVVWSCYKYIVEYNNACQGATSEQDTEALLPPPPPAYHLIAKVPMDQQHPPPPYEVNTMN